MRTNTSPSVRQVLSPQKPRRFGLWLLGPVVAALALGGASISAAHAQAVGEGQGDGQGLDPTDAGAMAGGFMARRMEKMLDKVGRPPASAVRSRRSGTGSARSSSPYTSSTGRCASRSSGR